MTAWIKRNYLAVLIVILILVTIPTLLRGFKIDLSVLLTGMVQSMVNVVTAYYVMKHLDKKDKK